MTIVFLGSDAIALPALDWLAGEGSGLARVTAVVTQPDRAAGRGQEVAPGAIKRWAEARGIAVRQPERLDEGDAAWLAGLQPDLALVMAYGQILRETFIGAPRLGTLNLHASILPAYRGASPIPAAIASGDRATGVSLMRIVRKLDAGPVADRESVALDPLDTSLDAEAKIAAACVPLLQRNLPRLAAGGLAFAPQDESRASFCRKLSRADGRLDFAAPAAVLAARINALHPWPGCSVELAGQTVKLGLADAAEERAGESAAPGSVLGADEVGLRVVTAAGVLRLRKLQRPGGRMLPAPEFLRGFPARLGERIPSHEMTALVTKAP